MTLRPLLCALALWLAGCAWITGASEPETPDRSELDVVDSDGPFDPAEAVRDAEAEGEEAVRVRAEDAGGRAREAAVDRAVREADAADGADEEVKERLAANPPAQETRHAEPLADRVVDAGLEALLVAIAAALVTALGVGLARRPGPVVFGVVATGGLLALVVLA